MCYLCLWDTSYRYTQIKMCDIKATLEDGGPKLLVLVRPRLERKVIYEPVQVTDHCMGIT